MFRDFKADNTSSAMNKPIPGQQGHEQTAPPDVVPSAPGGFSASRRRLVRAGASAVPVVATLASRPAHAWHCKAASAWGSVVANPNTSLKNNASQQVYSDETWTLTNWVQNTARSNAADVDSKPWNKLKKRFSGIDNSATRNKNDKFDHTLVTVSILRTNVSGFVNPAGASGGDKVVDVMRSGSADFVRYCIAAQLNFILLSPSGSNGIEQCLSLNDLRNMAKLKYPLDGPPWDDRMVVRYLNDNWIVRVA